MRTIFRAHTKRFQIGKIVSLIVGHVDDELRVTEAVVVDRYAQDVDREQSLFVDLDQIVVQSETLEHIHDVLGKKYA